MREVNEEGQFEDTEECETCKEVEEEKPWAKDLERKVEITEVDHVPEGFDWVKDPIIPKKSQYPPHVIEPADLGEVKESPFLTQVAGNH